MLSIVRTDKRSSECTYSFKNNSILVYGHLHIPFIKEKDGNYYINPGSISLPKSEYGPTYLVLEDNKFVIYDLDNKKIAEKEVF